MHPGRGRAIFVVIQVQYYFFLGLSLDCQHQGTEVCCRKRDTDREVYRRVMKRITIYLYITEGSRYRLSVQDEEVNGYEGAINGKC
jgi:hypothetical protein